MSQWARGAAARTRVSQSSRALPLSSRSDQTRTCLRVSVAPSVRAAPPLRSAMPPFFRYCRCFHIHTHKSAPRHEQHADRDTSRAHNRRDTRFAESFFRFTHRRITRGVKNIAYFSCVLYCIYAIESARRRFLLYCKVLYIQYCIDVHLYCTDLLRLGTRVVV